MLVVMNLNSTEEQVNHLREKAKEFNCSSHIIYGASKIAIGITGDTHTLSVDDFLLMEGVIDAMRVSKPYKLVSREMKDEDSLIRVGNDSIGGPDLQIIAGPCSVETREQTLEIAKAVKASGAHMLRGGAFKPRTSPYSFQGLGEAGLKILAEARDVTGLPIVTEVVDARDVELVSSYADMLQIGARNNNNFALLKEVGISKKPVLLKRGISSTTKEYLLSAEYIMAQGNYNIVLCERGIRSFETATRNTLDISAVPLIKSLSHLPILVDPSHATGLWHLVIPLALASIVAGADGVMVEVHHNPSEALSDGEQSLKPEKFKELVDRIRGLLPCIGRSMA